MKFGQKIYMMLEELAQISEKGPGVTRLYLTPEHKKALGLLEKWMKEAGLSTKRDAAGNLIGDYRQAGATKTLVLGSHQDSVRKGGKYDGALGVVLPIVCAKEMIERGQLSCNLRVIAFGDEEGIRFSTTYLGCMAYTGRLDLALLERRGKDGLSFREALIAFGSDPEQLKDCRETEQIDAYLEVHIEQGPVLEKQDLSVGIVTAIQSSHRYEIIISGMAGHAGTVPMSQRNDPMATAAKAINAIFERAKSKAGLVATVGSFYLEPGAVNVIPEKASFSLDIRCPQEQEIFAAMADIRVILDELCALNGTSFDIKTHNQVAGTACDQSVIDSLCQAVSGLGMPVLTMTSGAGHDAQAMKELTKIGLLFVRCKDGISHSALESVEICDIEDAAQVVMAFIRDF